jgi:hypothetical protein
MFCKNCGAQIDDKAVICVKCGVPVKTVGPDLAENACVRMLIPIGRSGWAIAAGYFGLLSLIPFVGVLAILFGILALRDIKAHPEKHGAGRAWFGIIAGVLFGGISLLIFMAAR